MGAEPTTLARPDDATCASFAIARQTVFPLLALCVSVSGLVVIAVVVVGTFRSQTTTTFPIIALWSKTETEPETNALSKVAI